MVAKNNNRIHISPMAVDYTVFAINTNSTGFQVCDTINKLFSIEMKGNKPIDIAQQNGNIVSFSLFSCYDQIRKVQFSLIENSTPEGVLTDSIKNISFFLKVAPLSNEGDIEEYTKQLSSIPEFRFIQKVAKENFKPKQKKAFDAIFQYL